MTIRLFPFPSEATTLLMEGGKLVDAIKAYRLEAIVTLGDGQRVRPCLKTTMAVLRGEYLGFRVAVTEHRFNGTVTRNFVPA